MLQLSKLMSCLYDCIYISLKYQRKENALHAVTAPLGFSVEGTIKSRSWLICGQSDIDYYDPGLNCGYQGRWKQTSYAQLRHHLQQILDKGTSLIVEADASLIPYYQPGSLEVGIVHSFVILDWCKHTDDIYVYDRLASKDKITRDANHGFWTNISVIKKALESHVYVLELDEKATDLSWKDEIELILSQSIKNMTKEVSRSQASYQCFGLEAIRLLANSLGEFNPCYREDTQATSLLSYTIPTGIFQSVYGNRFLLKKALKNFNSMNNRFDPIIISLNESLAFWEKFRKECVLCAQGASTYEDLQRSLLNVYDKEVLVINSIKSIL